MDCWLNKGQSLPHGRNIFHLRSQMVGKRQPCTGPNAKPVDSFSENVDYSWCNLLGTRMVHVKSIALILKRVRENWYWSDYGWPWPENTDVGYCSVCVPMRKHFRERFTVSWNKETHKRHTCLKYFEMG